MKLEAKFYAENNKLYFLDGKEIKKADLQATGLIQASYFNKLDEKPDVLTIKLENLAFIGKKNF